MSNANCYMSNAICSISQMLCALCQIPYASYCILIFICRLLNAKCSLRFAKLSLYVNLKYYMSKYHISLRMPSALFYMLYAKCNVLCAKLHMLDCNMLNAMTISMSFNMTTEQVGHLVIYIHYLAMTFHIAITEKRLLSYYYGFNLYLKDTCIWVCQHFRASSKNLKSQLFHFTDISGHRSKSPIAVYFGSPTDQGIDQ
jgi:hypothetical protein